MPALAHTSPSIALVIGNFDGVHLGHAALLREARAQVGETGRVVALAFDPHPMTVLRPEAAPARLSTFEQRTRWLTELGADEVTRLDPSPDVLRQSPEEFIAGCVERWRPGVIVEGADFHFGRGRVGTIDSLRAMEPRFGYRTIVVPPVNAMLADQSLVAVSSSMTRWLIGRGRVRDAQSLLGRPYELEGVVARGEQRGRVIGFPTANLDRCTQLMPADGVYAGLVRRGDRSWLAAISVGTKPTFGEHPRTCEAHLLDYDGPPPMDDYGWNIRVQFTHWLREQLRYDSVDALIAQLHRDIDATRSFADQGPGIAIPGLSESRCA